MIVTGIGVAAAAGAVWLSSASRRREPRLLLQTRQRVLFNGLQSAPAIVEQTVMLRQLLVAGLRQSPLLGLVPDEQVSAALRQNDFPLVPAPFGSLLAAARSQRATLLMDGLVERTSRGLSVLLRVFRSAEPEPVFEARQTGNEKQLVRLADDAVMDLRSDFESALSLESSHTPLHRVLSESPEAVDRYFRGVRAYEASDSTTARAYFDQAIRVDPQFALAHQYRALALWGDYKTTSGFEAGERAYSLRARTVERDRNWIEFVHASMSGDWEKGLEPIRRNATLYPEEAIFQRHAASALAQLRRFPEAVDFNRRALELDPFSGSNHSEFLVNLAEGNRADEALREYDRLHAQTGAPLLDWSRGIALLAKERYDDAAKALGQLASHGDFAHWARVMLAAPAVMLGKFDEAAAGLEADLARDAVAGSELPALERVSVLSQVYLLMGQQERAAEQARVLCLLPSVAPHLNLLRQGCLWALRANDLSSAEKAVASLREIEGKWRSTHSSGGLLQSEGLLLEAKGDLDGAADRLNKAQSLWGDPLTLFSAASVAGRQKRYAVQREFLTRLEPMRASMFRYHLPGLAALTAIENARLLFAMSLFGESLREYKRILAHWGANAAVYPLVQSLRSEAAAIR